MYGTGYYNISSPEDIWDLMRHRRRQLEAITHKAQDDDELRRELQMLDADLAAGIAQLEAMEEEERQRLGVKLRRRIERHAR